MLIMELRKIHKTKLNKEIQMNKIKKPRTEMGMIITGRNGLGQSVSSNMEEWARFNNNRLTDEDFRIAKQNIRNEITEIKEALSTEQKCAIFDLENEIKFLMMAQQVQHTLNQINRQVLLGDK